MSTLPFPPVEMYLIGAYARWAGGQVAGLTSSSADLHHAIGRFMANSKLLTPHAQTPGVARFIRLEFEAGWEEARAGHPPSAPCGWPGPA